MTHFVRLLKTTKQVKSFWGTTNYYRRYLERYAQRSAALRELTAKDKPFVWGEAQDSHSTILRKRCLIHLQYYDCRQQEQRATRTLLRVTCNLLRATSNLMRATVACCPQQVARPRNSTCCAGVNAAWPYTLSC